MRITLDQPTFLTSFTNEKPGENKTDSSQTDTPDFLNCMLALNTEEDVGEPKEITGKMNMPGDDQASDEKSMSDDLTKLLIDLGYLSTPAPEDVKTVPINMNNTTNQLETLSQEMTSMNDVGVMEDSSAKQSMSLDLKQGMTDASKIVFDNSAATMPTQRQIMPEDKDDNESLVNQVKNKTEMKDLIQASNEVVNETANKISNFSDSQTNNAKRLSLDSDERKVMSTEIEKAAIPLNEAQGKPIEIKVKPTPKTNEKIMINKQGHAEIIKHRAITTSTETADADAPSKISSSASKMLESFDLSKNKDEKVMTALEDFATWTQGKVNTTLINASMSTRDVLKSKDVQLATEAVSSKSTLPASVEITRSMNPADINLANYQVKIKIYPPELGKITASLKLSKNSTSLEVVAETKEVKALLQTHLSSLKEQFTQSNVHLEKVDVFLANEKQENLEKNTRDQRQESDPEAFLADDQENQPRVSKQKQKSSQNTVDAYV